MGNNPQTVSLESFGSIFTIKGLQTINIAMDREVVGKVIVCVTHTKAEHSHRS